MAKYIQFTDDLGVRQLCISSIKLASTFPQLVVWYVSIGSTILFSPFKIDNTCFNFPLLYFLKF